METETNFNVFVKIDDLNEEYKSPELVMSGMPWCINICKRRAKRSFGATAMVDIFLMSSFVFETLDWLCEAEMSITLHAIDGQSHVKSLPRTQFSNRNSSRGLMAFIEWTDLQQYEREGKVCFVVHLATNPVRFQPISEIEQTRVKFRVTVENISEFKAPQFSPTFLLRGTLWKVKIVKTDEKMGVFLCEERGSQNKTVTWTASFSFSLLSFDDQVPPIVQTPTVHTFDHRSQGWGYIKFVTWDTLTDESKKYVKDDMAVFEVDLDVSPPKPFHYVTA